MIGIVSKDDPTIKSVETEERPVPEHVQELFDAREDAWRRDVEWKQERRELEGPSEREREAANRIIEVIGAGLANELDDPNALPDALATLQELQAERAEQLLEHYERREQAETATRED